MSEHVLRCGLPERGGRELRWRGTAVMGILNVTPDSFSDGGRFAARDAAIEHGLRMAADGASMIDVGGESTRPGADPVSEAEELRRVVPVVEALRAQSEVLVSVDTYKPAVARAAVEAGAELVNDVTGLRDPEMLRTCSELGVPVVVMHMQGEPRSMQVDPHYADVVAEVSDFLAEQATRARDGGVPDLLLDPGLGFGKTPDHNRQLLVSLQRLTAGEKLLVGFSRKSTIGLVAGERDAGRRDAGSIAAHLHAASAGAAAVRVHDVAGHVQALRVWEWLRG